jgi:dTDP-4-amino-4,6-dideoxygalactose transaminase
MQQIPWWYTQIGEEERRSLLSAFEQKRFSQGAVTDEFEQRLAAMLAAPYVVVTTSGTAALTRALLALGVGPGDEVIVPALTWLATANAAAILGARVVLVDCLPDLPLIDPSAVRRKLSARTKVIIPVHLNGRSCRLDELKAIAQEAGAAIVRFTFRVVEPTPVVALVIVTAAE